MLPSIMICTRIRKMERMVKIRLLILTVICIWITFVNFTFVSRSKKAEIATSALKDILKNSSDRFLNSLSSSIENTLSHNISISVCVPAIARDINSNLPRLLQSISAQTVLPLEVVIVISDTNKTNCALFKQNLKSIYNVTTLHLHCIAKLQYQSVSRQNASSFSHGSIISFIDADDVMFPNRLEVLSHIFRTYKPFMALHGFTKKVKPSWNTEWKKAKIIDGIKLYDVAEETRRHHAWILEEIMLSQVSVYREVCKLVEFRTSKKYYRSEDAWFVRDVLSFFGRRNNTAIFINTPLAWHVPREYQNRKSFVQVPAEFRIRKISQTGVNGIGIEKPEFRIIMSLFWALVFILTIIIVLYLNVKHFSNCYKIYL